MTRKPVRGLRLTFVLLNPSVNWPKVRRVGDDARRLLNRVMCGSPFSLTVASTPIFMAGAWASISARVKTVRCAVWLMLPAPFSFEVFGPCRSGDHHARGVDAGRPRMPGQRVELPAAHQRSLGKIPRHTQPLILVAAHVVERAQLPPLQRAVHGVSQPGTDGTQIGFGCRGPGNQRRADPDARPVTAGMP